MIEWLIAGAMSARHAAAAVLFDVLAQDVVIDPTDASVKGSVNADGTMSQTVGGATSGLGTWLTEGANSDWEVYLSGTGDTPSGAALNTWLNCGTTREWSLARTSIGQVAFDGTLQIRSALTGVVADTCAFSLLAAVDV